MERIIIRGGKPLRGRIRVAGAKNAALPLMVASLLTDQDLTLTNLPALTDVETMAALLADLGVVIDPPKGMNGETAIRLNAGRIASTTAPYEQVAKMRASVLVLGPLVARIGRAQVSLPGGDSIGIRPVDLHLDALRALGAKIDLVQGDVIATAPNGLIGAVVRFPMVSVGATENLLMAATLAAGETVIENAAREPEIVDLANCLGAMGAEISGAGTERIVVRGVPALGGARHRIMPDRVESGTYAMAAAITGGDLELVGGEIGDLGIVAEKLRTAGALIEPAGSGFRVRGGNRRLQGVDVITQPFPGFATDLQAQFMVLMALADGAAMITETVFENRFMHVPELVRLGANITVHGASALVRGVERLTGAPVMATDIRASISLVLAGLAAEGETAVHRVYHLDRGYENLETKLRGCGADIRRVDG